MINLVLIGTEARRILGRISESRRHAEQSTLAELCELHWQMLRGVRPASPLAQALWSVTPPLADLLLDLYAQGDSRLDEVPHGRHLAKGMALLVFVEIESANEAGVHIAHESMMAF